jgi:predicted  nucleic acid-binding Zn-ribbon protein
MARPIEDIASDITKSRNQARYARDEIKRLTDIIENYEDMILDEQSSLSRHEESLGDLNAELIEAVKETL